jgi:hypothetical protein
MVIHCWSQESHLHALCPDDFHQMISLQDSYQIHWWGEKISETLRLHEAFPTKLVTHVHPAQILVNCFPENLSVMYPSESQNSLQATNFSYIKQNSNQSELTEYNSGVRFHLKIEILEPVLLKALCMIVDSPWYMPNTVIQRDLQIPTLKEEICHNSQYSARLSAHPNDLTVNLIELSDNRRLRRHLPNDLPSL